MSEELEFNVDFSEAVERVLLPVDWYEVEVERVDVKQSKKGEGMLNVMFNVVEGEYAGQKIFTNMMLEGKGAGITKGAFRVLLGTVEGGRYSIADLQGSRAKIRVTQAPWAEEDGGDGELQNKISKYKASEAVAGLRIS